MTTGRLVMSSVLTIAALSGCAVPKKGGFSDVASTVEERTGHRVTWAENASEDSEVAKAVHRLLANELGVEQVLEVALLNNPTLQARYEDLGIAEADLVQAGLLSNPVLGASVRFEHGSSGSTNTNIGVVQDFLDLLLRPSRKRLAQASFEETKLHVAHSVLDFAADVKVAFYTLQGDMHVTSMLRTTADAAHAAYEFARRQHEAGNLSELGLTAEQGLYEQARIELAHSELEVASDRERLTRLMGLWGADTAWTVAPTLPDVPPSDPSPEHLESLAVSRRLDLEAMHWEVERLSKAYSITVHWRLVPFLSLGVSTERDPGGQVVTGPEAAIAIPIFDQGQARVARVAAFVRQSRQRMTALAIDIRSNVRDARARLLAARDVARHYRTVAIPLRERMVEQSVRHYNYMLVGVYQLLQAKQSEIDAYQRFIEAVRDYWIARSELERAVGGELEASNSQAQQHLEPKR